jgi:hypothetical protein
MVSSGLLRRVALVRIDVSEEPGASFIRVAKIGELGTTQAATSNRRTLRRNTIILVTGLCGLHGCEISKISHCLDNRLTDGGEIIRINY